MVDPVSDFGEPIARRVVTVSSDPASVPKLSDEELALNDACEDND